jgi:hypothetical protein
MRSLLFLPLFLLLADIASGVECTLRDVVFSENTIDQQKAIIVAGGKCKKIETSKKEIEIRIQKLIETYDGCTIDVTISNNTDINFKTFRLGFVALDAKGYPFDNDYFRVKMRPNQRVFHRSYIQSGLASGNNCTAIRGIDFNQLHFTVYDKDNIPQSSQVMLIEDTIELDELQSYTRDDFFEIVTKAIIFDNKSPITKIVKNILPRTF